MIGRDELLEEARDTLLAGGAARAWVLVGPPGSGRTRLAREIAIEAELAGKHVIWVDAAGPLTPERVARIVDDTLLVLDDLDVWSEGTEGPVSLMGLRSKNFAILSTQVRPPESGDGIYKLLLGVPEPPAPATHALQPLTLESIHSILATFLGSEPPERLVEDLVSLVGAHPGPLLAELGQWLDRGRLTSVGSGWRINDSASLDTT